MYCSILWLEQWIPTDAFYQRFIGSDIKYKLEKFIELAKKSYVRDYI